MLRKLSLVLLVLLVVSCATVNHPPLGDLNDVTPGMAKSEIISKWGNPVSTQFIDGYHVLHYSFAVPNTLGVTEGYDFYFDGNDKLAAWQKVGREGKGGSTGVIIQLPQP